MGRTADGAEWGGGWRAGNDFAFDGNGARGRDLASERLSKCLLSVPQVALLSHQLTTRARTRKTSHGPSSTDESSYALESDFLP